jgi:hypothetical protein
MRRRRGRDRPEHVHVAHLQDLSRNPLVRGRDGLDKILQLQLQQKKVKLLGLV